MAGVSFSARVRVTVWFEIRCSRIKVKTPKLVAPYVQKDRRNLRTGFTTGTSATAASKAALLAIIRQAKIDAVKVKLPKGEMEIPISSCEFAKSQAKCSVIKDGGDDPDVTHGAEIVAELSLSDSINEVRIDGGKGVGIVTKPGLGLEINKPAINPVPRKMIEGNLREVAKEILAHGGIRVVISVPKGRELGPKTDNPRIGILNGISILGTSGIVIPFSTAAYAASIRQNIDVALAMGDSILVLATGGRSEDFAKKLISLPEHCFVQMGDFAGYTIRQCAQKPVKKAYIVGFIGKLAKMAAGAKQTHVKGSKVDMVFLAELAGRCGADRDAIENIRKANTARHVSEVVKEREITGFFEIICAETHRQMRKHSEEKVELEVVLFDFDGRVLARSQE